MMSRRLVVLTVVAVTLGGLIFLTATSDVVELATSGGIEVLREPMRPIRGETRVLLIGLDGVGSSVLYEAIRNGAMPNVSALLGASLDTVGTSQRADGRDSARTSGEHGNQHNSGDAARALWEHGYGASGVMSVLPAETTAGWTAVFTGARPAESGVPGNEWFVRDSLVFYAPVPLSVDSYSHTLRIYTDGLVGERIQVPTLFERVDDLRSHVALGLVSRGADLLTPPNFSRLPLLLDRLVDAALDRISAGEALYETLDRSAVTGVHDAAEAHGLPDLQFVYFPGIDLLTHASDSALHRQREYLRTIIDPSVGDLLDLYRARGALDQTYVLFVADHGHTPHLRDDEHALDEEPLAFLDSLGLRVREPSTDADSTGRYDAVFAANEAFAYIYLADRSTCPGEDDACDWRRPPRLAEDVLPVLRAVDAANQTGAHGPGLRGTIDLILAREHPSKPFGVFDGDTLVALDEYLARNPRPDLADFSERMSWLTGGPFARHAGDIALLARGGANLPVEERFYFAPPHHSGHGGAGRQDGAIPLLLAQTGASGAGLRALLGSLAGEHPSQLSITPLVEALLEQNALAMD